VTDETDQTSKKRSAAEAWEALEDMAAQDELDRVLSLSEKELDAELAEAGFDPERVRAKGEEVAAKILGRASADVAAPARRPGRAPWFTLASAAALAAAAAVALFVGPTPDGHRVASPPGPTPAEVKQAAELSRKGLDECASRAWRACLEDLRAAQGLDPSWKDDPRVTAAIARARSALPNADAGPPR
jgi:hypothetical protein